MFLSQHRGKMCLFRGNILDFATFEMIHVDMYAICHVPSVRHNVDRSLLDLIPIRTFVEHASHRHLHFGCILEVSEEQGSNFKGGLMSARRVNCQVRQLRRVKQMLA